MLQNKDNSEQNNKKKISIVSFTPDGLIQAERILNVLKSEYEFNYAHKPSSLKTWVFEAFHSSDAIIFVCAMGIAVRSIAPHIVKKTVDPAVIVMDDMGNNIISVLSGHIGGANDLTRLLAEKLDVHPVITTSSDVHGRIAIDSWAVSNKLTIADMYCAKAVAAEIVAGRPVGFYCEGEMKDKLPKEFLPITRDSSVEVTEDDYWANLVLPKPENKKMSWCVMVTDKIISGKEKAFEDCNVLHLIPRCNVIGMGCKKDKPFEDIKLAIEEQLEAAHIDARSILALASIDVKKDEAGLLSAAEYLQVPISFYSVEELEAVKGDFPPSEFVQGTVGVDNVCERAAIARVSKYQRASRQDNLVINKTKCGGITFAMARKKWSVDFE